MPRLTISLPDNLYQHLSEMASLKNESLSQVINDALLISTHQSDVPCSHTKIEEHCQQLIMQMNAIVKNLAFEVLGFQQSDFEKLWKEVLSKHHEMGISLGAFLNKQSF